MRISGFTFCRNADSLYYPIEASIRSALLLVDEFVVVLGDGDPEDRTQQIIASIQDPKIKIIRSTWDLNEFQEGTIHAQQTDLAKSHCTGDWLLYLQADEVLHEEDLPKIKQACEAHFSNTKVEGMLFDYRHFWGDYKHVVRAHGWYPHEIRIIRNRPDIHSWESAQSFRVIPDFDGIRYRGHEGSRKLKVVHSDARIFHYGWVRPPELMTKKMQAMDKHHSHSSMRFSNAFDYGDLSRLEQFPASHPSVMNGRIAELDWSDKLNLNGDRPLIRKHRFKHERLKYRLLHWLESRILGGKEIFSFQNYELLDH